LAPHAPLAALLAEFAESLNRQNALS